MTTPDRYLIPRQKLVDSLIQKGITHPQVIAAMLRVPRHLFFEEYLRHHAYTDKAFPIAARQTISQPYTVAYQTQLLNPQPDQSVLEIGTGSGYQAAILSECKMRVYTIERHYQLHHQARQLLASLCIKAYLHHGDGTQGLPTFGPFDAILITAATHQIPDILLRQLKIQGKLVVPLGPPNKQTMVRFTRLSESDFDRENFATFQFVPLLPGTEK
jgi:protein-L-isoaspartate(D-aspartate) O-methyltransferase